LPTLINNTSTFVWFIQVTTWITEKLQVALDESYRDPTNLQAKLQKHQAFEAEVTANRNRVDAVVEVCVTVNNSSTIFSSPGRRP